MSAGLALVALSVLVLAGCGFAGPDVSADASYARFPDASSMARASEIVVEISGTPQDTGRTVTFPGRRVAVHSDGRTETPSISMPVYEATVARVVMGAERGLGSTVLVVPAVDQDAAPVASQTSLLLAGGPLTLYLVAAAGESEVWTTLSPYQGIENL